MRTKFVVIVSFLILVSIYESAFAQCNGSIVLIENGLVIDGTGAPPKRGIDLLIKDGEIKEIGKNLSISGCLERIDATNLTILPGLIDMHAHLYVNQGSSIRNQRAYLNLYLSAGVTTIYSPGEYDPEGTLNLKNKINHGIIDGPDIYTAGPYFDDISSRIPWMSGVQSVEELEQKYRQWNNKIDGVKVYTSITEIQLKKLIELADKDELLVTGHLNSVTASKAIDFGIDGLEHGFIGMPEFFDKGFTPESYICQESSLDVNNPKIDSILNKIIDNRVFLTPTIVSFKMLLDDFEPVTEWQSFVNDDLLSLLVEFENSNQITTAVKNCISNAISKQNNLLNELKNRGGLIVAGTDPVIPIITPGFSLHREMALLVDAGFSPMESIQSATNNAAKALRKDALIGTLEVGKQANMLIVKGNPAEDIKDIGNTVIVIKQGKIYNPDVLLKHSIKQIGNESHD